MANSETAILPAATVEFGVENENIFPEASDEFVSTPYVEELIERALTYLQVGCPVHFAGPAGTGKTTLALHVASKLCRPVVLIYGDEEFAGSDLVGKDAGYRRSKLIDNFIHSVLKTEEEVRTFWVDNRLTTACREGCTLIYDEFNRSRPEANNTILNVLSERILNLPRLRMGGRDYLEVNPEFRAIFTSNPEEYAGTHKAQDALLDRLITIRLGHYDRETEVRITLARSGVSRADAETIVDIARDLRTIGVSDHSPTIRACIAVAKVLAHRGAQASSEDPVFRWVCKDVFNPDMAKVTRGGRSVVQRRIDEVIRTVCGHQSKHKSE